LLTGKQTYLTQWQQERQAFNSLLDSTEKLAGTSTERQLIAAIGESETSSLSKSDALIALRTNHDSLETISSKYLAAANSSTQGASLSTTVAAFVAAEQKLLQSAVRSSSNTASDAETIIIVLIVVFALLSGALAFVLSRSLRRRLGTAVG
jgi:CHASE3 domain sensor protein